jgi:3-methyladenine DNA glycosylase AlkD
MSTTGLTAGGVVTALRAHQSDAELPKVRKRLAPDEEAIGVRMRHLFDVAEAHTDLPLGEVDRLLDHPAYEPRMAAMCILDFKARRRIDDHQRHDLFQLYLSRHDRITTWDMVDRSAPRVVGGYLTGRSLDPLHDLTGSDRPLARRTAMTAPLYVVHAGSDTELVECFTIARRLATDPEPVVHNAVGIFLKHAGTRDRNSLHDFLATHAAAMPRSAVRLAISKLDAAERSRYLT